MSYWVAGTAGVMATTSLVSGIMGGKAAAKEADRRREAEMKAAKMKFAAEQSSINIMKEAGREASLNAVSEVARAGGAQKQKIKDEVQKATSTSLANSEGVTSGRSKGRDMVSLKIKGNKVVEASKQEEANMISKITEAQDKQTNDLNNKLFGAHQQLTNVLSTPGAIYQQNVAGLVGGTINAGFSGAQLGMGLKKEFGTKGG